MNRKTAEVLHQLLKTGYIDRVEQNNLWTFYTDDPEVAEDFETLKEPMGFDLVSTGNRLYMVPTQYNDLYLKNNMDFKHDIKAESSSRIKDLYLMNYAAVYLLYLFFSGEGGNFQCREFISKSEFISEFSKHCSITQKLESDETENDYSENFENLANDWLGKLEGESSSQKIDEKYGVVNRLLSKFKIDDLFIEGEDGLIKPTRKLKDLMPYFLRKDRIMEINSWINKEEENAKTK